ncbi:MAG TPA: hypothetical protein VFJ47_01185 [Terriglobales bacterium]|nr:hypothetical protein [Terriglobales bacterium]
MNDVNAIVIIATSYTSYDLMQRTVEAHIRDLEGIMHRLNDELMQQDDIRLRNVLEARVRAADQALQHFRAALVLEERVRHEA